MLTFRNKFRVCASRQAVSKLTGWKKTTGAAIGYNVRLANNSLRYNLRLP